MASGPGNRKVPEVTSVPSRSRDVCTASAPSVTHESVGPGRPSVAIETKWSLRKKPSKPVSSASSATRR